MRSARWVAYAFVALVMRFWGLARQADSADVFVVLAGYLIMHLTFARLFLSMRRMGSNFWLPGTVLLSSCFAFLVALLAASVLGIQVDPVCLSEALPFLVITVGFDKPFALARAVFTSPEIAPVLLRRRPFIAPGDDEDEPARPARKDKVEWAPPVPARDIAVNAVSRVGPSIVHDYALEVAVLTVGAASGVGGLKEFCKLAALILVADCCFLFSFYVAILTIMVEVS
jgi:hydroxymethylglutaryl-CoA reductase (NADPH)